MGKAQDARLLGKFKEALRYYNMIIKQSKESNQVKILKIFATASFRKASIYQFQQPESHNIKIEIYDTVIKKFEKKQEVELLKLYAKAQFYKAYISDRDKSKEIYDEIINKLSNSLDIELLKIYASAQFKKYYLTSDEESIEVLNNIIKKFKMQDNEELLMQLYKAQHDKAHILKEFMNQKEEAIEVYDEIIKKFSSYPDREYQKIIDNAYFSKSFLLMGDRDDEAMEIYDDIIKNYEKNNLSKSELLPLPTEVEFSIINNIELALITNTEDSEYRDLAKKYLKDNKDIKPELDMLEILREAQISNQDKEMKTWQEQNKNYNFRNWSFNELRQWSNQMEESEQKTRINSYLDKFIKHNSRSR